MSTFGRRSWRLLTTYSLPLLRGFLYLAVPATVIDKNICKILRVDGPSMAPTFAHGDTILFRTGLGSLEEAPEEVGQPLTHVEGRNQKLSRGMMVLFWTPHNPERYALKRVVALEDDRITPARRPRPINGVGEGGVEGQKRRDLGRFARKRRLMDLEVQESRVDNKEEERLETVTVPFGHVWVEGDNVETTYDSNDYGPISKTLIVGLASSVLWPWERRRRIKWQEDDWEAKVGGRLMKRSNPPLEVPEAWKMYD